jgi:uncharacterized protein YndB with AHSA1/START domain
MTKTNVLEVKPRGEREIVMTRAFDAAKQLVYDAWTKPELVKRWLTGPDGWTMPVCEIDLRVGGAYRYEWKKESHGAAMGMGGTYQEIVPGERIVATERFDDPWYPGDAVVTTTWEERGGKTTVTTVVQYASKEARDGVLASPMESGVAAGYDRLERLLETL